jgi:hypothetical protein
VKSMPKPMKKLTPTPRDSDNITITEADEAPIKKRPLAIKKRPLTPQHAYAGIISGGDIDEQPDLKFGQALCDVPTKADDEYSRWTDEQWANYEYRED